MNNLTPGEPEPTRGIVVIISANAEWNVMRAIHPAAEMRRTPFGEWFVREMEIGEERRPVTFVHGGWGKIAAAASAQHAIDRFRPELLVNIGTCGGFAGLIERGTVVVAERTVVYDIIEMMGDQEEATAHYMTEIDLSWLGESLPTEALRTLLVSADRDLMMNELPDLRARYNAVAGDWESGAIAWVAARNGVRPLILRSVSDLVGDGGGDAYGRIDVFHESTREVMAHLLAILPRWIAAAMRSRVTTR
ncbi:MAG: putative Adenosylhomocysteine nucleosidase [Chlorobi bacterium]|nr:putative Adenosylhomocysteine nucleosidase [Chlorobiota bacterium]